jgi:hypothetical protein
MFFLLFGFGIALILKNQGGKRLKKELSFLNEKCFILF